MTIPINFFFRLVNSKSYDEFKTILYNARRSELYELEYILLAFNKTARKHKVEDRSGNYNLFRDHLCYNIEKLRRQLCRALCHHFKKQYDRAFYHEDL